MDRPRWRIPVSWEIGIVNALLLLPATWFWLSAMLYVSLGTDYFFDVTFDQMGRSVMGSIALVAMVIGLPGMAIGVNGLVYIRKKHHLAWWGVGVATIFLAAGFFAALKRI